MPHAIDLLVGFQIDDANSTRPTLRLRAVVLPEERHRRLELGAHRIDDVAHAIGSRGRGRAFDDPLGRRLSWTALTFSSE
jgi:hypothetical protein